MLSCDIHKTRAAFTVAVQFTANAERLALFGPSGCGKSTILSCIAGIEAPDAGYVRCGDQTWYPPSTPLHQRAVGYVTQKERLFPHLSVAENVLFALPLNDRQRHKKWVDEIKVRLSLSAFWDARAHELSGGQARRVAIGRALARRPPLVLLDEPFAGLDRPLVKELIQVLKEWQEEWQFILLAVDHDPLALEALCPHVIALEEGRIIQKSTWTLLAQHPPSPTFRGLLDRTP